MRVIPPVLVLVLALVAAPLARTFAQGVDFLSIANSYGHAASSIAGTTAVNSAIAQSARIAAGTAPGTPAGTAAGAASADLSYSPSASVRQAVNARMADLFAGAAGTDRAAVLQLLESGMMHAAFAEMLAEYGYSDRDLGDVLTAFVLVSWQAANNDAAAVYPGHPGAEAVRGNLRGLLAGSGELRALGDADRQQLAETFALLTTALAAAWANADQSGDAAEMAQVQAGAGAIGWMFGLDFQRLALSDGGFVPR